MCPFEKGANQSDASHTIFCKGHHIGLAIESQRLGYPSLSYPHTHTHFLSLSFFFWVIMGGAEVKWSGTTPVFLSRNLRLRRIVAGLGFGSFFCVCAGSLVAVVERVCAALMYDANVG